MERGGRSCADKSILEPLIPPAKPGGRPRTTNMCEVMNALFYLWRWIVERTFGWLSTWRRLSKDYEVLPSSEEAWIFLAMIRLMLSWLAKPAEAATAQAKLARAA